MVAPTHIAFGILCAATANAGYWNASACGFGALLCDLDHPRSALGRIFFFLSYPLNMRFGHRGAIHGLPLWVSVLVIGILTHAEIVQWMAMGAISHAIIDCYNKSGVRLLAPFSDRIFVVFNKDEWQIRTGSLQEIYVFVAIFIGISTMQYAYTLGGPRKLINLMAQSPRITAEEFTRAGNAICYAEGKFRWADGQIEQVKWLIVGSEGQQLVYWNGERLIRNGRHGEFLRSTLRNTEAEWPLLKVRGLVTVLNDTFFFDGTTWHLAPAGTNAYGTIKTITGAMPEIQVQRQFSTIAESLKQGGL